MRNVCIIFLLSIIISLTAIGLNEGGRYALNAQNTPQTQYLRVHIRADSNEESAQEVKYKVRDAVTEYLTPLVANYQTKTEALEGVKTHLPMLKSVAERTLNENGFAYGARVSVRQEKFPTRVYGEFVLESGVYDALIIELGSGAGDNWWCVVYPPLCFTAPTGNGWVYKSKILEIIQEFKARRANGDT